VGPWRNELAPYLAIRAPGTTIHESAANTYLDVYFQLGLIGIFAFLVLIALAFTRSWLLATRQASIVYLWPALTLTVLVSVGFVSSGVLADFGWLLVVVCSVTVARRLSWRNAFERVEPAAQSPTADLG
jgi:O-antigen ligase